MVHRPERKAFAAMMPKVPIVRRKEKGSLWSHSFKKAEKRRLDFYMFSFKWLKIEKLLGTQQSFE